MLVQEDDDEQTPSLSASSSSGSIRQASPSRKPDTYAAVLMRPAPPSTSSSPSPPPGAQSRGAAQGSGCPGKPPPKPPPSCVLGKPSTNLPLSQLTWGRTTLPWMGRRWTSGEGNECVVHGDVLHAPLQGFPCFASFHAHPRGLPAIDVSLSYNVRFSELFQWGAGGLLPGLCILGGSARRATYCHVRWTQFGCAEARVRWGANGPRERAYRDSVSRTTNRAGDGDKDDAFRRARIWFRAPGQWNEVVLRVRLNTVDETGARADGILGMSVNGRAAMLGGVTWRSDAGVRVKDLCILCRPFSVPSAESHAQFRGFVMNT